jgi:hypothetical protein
MHFSMKNYLKNNRNYTIKQAYSFSIETEKRNGSGLGPLILLCEAVRSFLSSCHLCRSSSYLA